MRNNKWPYTSWYGIIKVLNVLLGKGIPDGIPDFMTKFSCTLYQTSDTSNFPHNIIPDMFNIYKGNIYGNKKTIEKAEHVIHGMMLVHSVHHVHRYFLLKS